jgi:hypothetical protein
MPVLAGAEPLNRCYEISTVGAAKVRKSRLKLLDPEGPAPHAHAISLLVFKPNDDQIFMGPTS